MALFAGNFAFFMHLISVIPLKGGKTNGAFCQVSDDAVADIIMRPAVVYEDKDDSDGELTDATETDEDGEEIEE